MKTVYQDYTIALAAGARLDFQCHGKYLTILDNSLSTDMMVQFDGQPEQPIPKGFSVEIPENENFITIAFRNPSVSSATIRFAISNGKVVDNRNVITGTVNVDNTANTLTTPAKGTATTSAPGSPAVAASSANRVVIIQNHGSNPIWFGDANVDGSNSRGIKIAAGDGYELNTASAVYLRSTGGDSDYSIAVLSVV